MALHTVAALTMRRNENCDVDVSRLLRQPKLSLGLQRRLRSQHPHGGNMRKSHICSIKALTMLIFSLDSDCFGVFCIENVS